MICARSNERALADTFSMKTSVSDARRIASTSPVIEAGAISTFKRVPAWRFATDRGADAFISARKANRQGMPSRKDRPAAPAVKREAEEDWGGKRKASMTEPRRFPPPWTVGK